MTTLTMPWHCSDTCFICDAPASNIIFSPIYESTQDTSQQPPIIQNKQYFACCECYDIVRTDIIPKDNIRAGLISNYKYHGHSMEWILSGSSAINGGWVEHQSPPPPCSIPKIKYNDIATQISLTCCHCPQPIVINKYALEGNDTPVEYFVPVFFKKRIKRRNKSLIRHYNLEKLYQENPGMIGYYEIESDGERTEDEKRVVTVHNNNLFNMALVNNTIATTVIDLSKNPDCAFAFLPIELLHMIIKLVLKKRED